MTVFTQRKGNPTERRPEEEKTVVPQKSKRRAYWIGEWHGRDLLYSLGALFLHVLSLLAPFTFTWGAFWVFVLLHFLTGNLGITLSFHRNLSHRSFKLPKYLEYTFAYFGLHALQGDPIFWVSTHRYHHKFVDTNNDPHSPIDGLFHSHIGWLFDYNRIQRKAGRGSYKNAADLATQPYYRFLQKTFVYHFWLLSVILYLIGGLPFIVWGMGLRVVFTLHVTWLVNSVCHTWGRVAWNTGDLSKNNWLVALLTSGEGWHNNHHAFEYSARQGLEWWEIDMTFYFIKMLEYVGLATDVKVPSELHKQKLALRKYTEGISTTTKEWPTLQKCKVILQKYKSNTSILQKFP